ncbi:class I SAM-dependent methyltransferase [Lentzea rhizosphaerae]|uniref:Class I SAM-dependent methyltransferase n=1 Tax=Lentzea rhizosphaerae TaxID=2041025 RepID=A0ABV8C4G9_9PSEU
MVLADAISPRRILEIGPGTGQATLPLTHLGDMTAVELSPELAAVARSHAPAAQVVVADFDEWPLPAERFDLVVSATAFHWLDPATRMARCAAALRPGGALAVISTHHVAGGTEQFFVDVQEIYERWDPATPPGLRLSPTAEIPREFDESDLFGEPDFTGTSGSRPTTPRRTRTCSSRTRTTSRCRPATS